MPLSDVSLERLSHVHPELSARIQQLAAQLEQEDIPIVVTQGLRTWEEQDALYAQGRTTGGQIVTNAPGGYSWHNFGLACDVVPEDIVPDQPDWNTSHPAWQRLVSVGESLGLASGSEWRTFKDWPHFQRTGKFGANPDDNVRTIYEEFGITGVWQAAFGNVMVTDPDLGL